MQHATTARRLRPVTDDAPKILKGLQEGRTAQWAADAFGWPRHRIVALINDRAGWLYDPETDRARIFHTAEPAPEPETTMPATSPAADEAATEPVGIQHVGVLLKTAEESENATTRAAAARTRAAIEDLRQRVATETAEKQIRDRIAALEQQLADEQAKLRGVRPKKKPAPTSTGLPDGATHKDVRAWAKTAGVECPAIGRVPTAVMQAYRTAHGLDSDA